MSGRPPRMTLKSALFAQYTRDKEGAFLPAGLVRRVPRDPSAALLSHAAAV